MDAAANAQTLVDKFLFFEQLCLTEFERQVKPNTPQYAAQLLVCEQRLRARNNIDIVSAFLTTSTAPTYWLGLLELTARKTIGWQGGKAMEFLTVPAIASWIIDSAKLTDVLLRPSSDAVAQAYSVRAYCTLAQSERCRKDQLARAITLLCEAVQDAAMAAERHFVSQATLAVAFAFVDTTLGLPIGNYEVHPGMKRLFDAQRKNEYVVNQYSKYPNIPPAIEAALMSGTQDQSICDGITVLSKANGMIRP